MKSGVRVRSTTSMSSIVTIESDTMRSDTRWLRPPRTSLVLCPSFGVIEQFARHAPASTPPPHLDALK
jgi:hypothetical protein